MKEFFFGFLLVWIMLAGLFAAAAMTIYWQSNLFVDAKLPAEASLGIFCGFLVFFFCLGMFAYLATRGSP